MNLNLRKSIKSILLATSIATMTASAVASVGVQIPPPGPGEVPDYFGAVANYAVSPLPMFAQVTVTDASGTGAVLAATTYDYNAGAYTKGVADIQVVNGGTGYTANTLVTVSGGPDAVSFTVKPIIRNGVIIGIDEYLPFTVDNNGAITTTANPNYIGNQASPLTYLGTGFTKPIAGTGIRKFVDALPGIQGVSSYASSLVDNAGYHADGTNNLGQAMPLATPDTTTFPGSDYYVIALVEYTQKLHTDLPATHLRGYVQLDKDTGAQIGKPQYMGPIIVAQKDRPVRVKMVNQLSTGDLGRLPIPVDVTYMGDRGVSDTQNRTAMHLHGGNTPWISDGTARQTVKPMGEVNPNKGESARNVPDMWFDNSGNLLPNSPTCTQGTTTCTTVGATNDPGDGALTFYYTNQQSARLMFYHDHAEGLTRLNVYMGVAAPYVLQDQTEKDLVEGTNKSGNNPTNAQVLPSITDTIPLVIQEKTFVPSDKIPVITAFGAFKSQLNSQDPTWRWGSKATYGLANGGNEDTLNGPGDLWVGHIFSPNQNPGDTSGGNAVGRADYGPWFWPPFTGIQHGAVLNPYYDPACTTSANGYCEGQYIPGVPNGNTLTKDQLTALYNAVPGINPQDVAAAVAGQLTLSSPSGTPENYNDTPMVNGTAYPYVNVDPKPYRFRILSAANDRMLNLSLVVAASKNSPDTTAAGNAGANNGAIMCDGLAHNGVTPDQADCTEVKMVPFDKTQNTFKPFPSHWYSPLNGGVTWDGRPSGVFDPDSRGPAMVQVGVDGGFLSSPVVIPNQPVNFEYNGKNILVTNVKEHALLLGNAERADVVVDFTNFAGSTILLYNDAPAPLPAFDIRIDWYTGDPDNTDTGGAFSTVPGYGHNTRTLMQFRVSKNGGHTNPTPDDMGTIDLPKLTSAVQAAFNGSQEPIVVPQEAYNAVYGTNVKDVTSSNMSTISNTSLTFSPLAFDATGAIARDAQGKALLDTPVTLDLQPKSIIEDWTMDYGRMNALLGVEMPKTTAITNTAQPLGYVDPPTELVKLSEEGTPISGTLADGTTIWKITHNGVDSHPIHFHLFHVQLLNRVGWDGAIYPPEANELGWKDIVRMNPLSDVIVALRPKTMTLPFKLANSHHKLDPSGEGDTNTKVFYNLNPVDGVTSNVDNQSVNYGWEYIWHCHILGHEENDMMRSIAVAGAPEAPSITSVSGPSSAIVINWVDNSMTSNWVQIQRDTVNTFNSPNLATFNVPYASGECASQSGCTRSYTDSSAKPASNKYYYRLASQNTVGAGSGQQDQPRDPVTGVYSQYLPAELSSLLPTPHYTTATQWAGSTGGFDGYANVTASSAWVGATAQYQPTIGLTPTSLSFANQAFSSASAAKTVTVTNTSTGNTAGYLNVTNVAISDPVNYTMTHNCTSPMAPAAGGRRGAPAGSCTINVVFNPVYNVGGVNPTSKPATITITDDAGTNATITTHTVSVAGTAIAAPVAALSPTTLDFGNALLNKTTAIKTTTLTNTGTSVLNIGSVVATAPFSVATNNCGATLATNASCTVNVSYTPIAATASTATLTFTDNSGNVANSKQVVVLKGTGINAVAPVLTAALNPLPVNYLPTVNLAWTAASTSADPAQQDVYTLQRSAALATTNTACPATATVGNYTAIAPTTQPTVTSATDNTAAAGSSYCYLVSAVNTASATPFTSTAVKVTVPAAPAAATGLTTTFSTADALGVGNVTLKWTTSAGNPKATGYLVQICANTALNCALNPTQWVDVTTTAATTYSVTGLQLLSGTTANPFMFRVLAYNPVVAQSAVGGLGVGSVTPNWLMTATAATYPAPNAPTALTSVFSAQGNTLNLGWTPGVISATAPAATGYLVQQCTDAIATIATTCSSVSTAWADAKGILVGNSFNVQGLTGGKAYMFRVMATNPVASTPLTSGILSFGLPNAPASISASLVAGGQSINVAWPASVFNTQAPAATSYTVQQCIGTASACATGTWTDAVGTRSGTSFNVTGLTAGTSYMYRVSATNQFGVSGWTTVATAAQYTAPAAPTAVTASAATASSMTLSYASATAGPTAASSYVIEQCLNTNANNTAVANCTTWTSVGTVSTASTTVSGLQAGQSYFFRVVASNGLNSAATNSAIAWTVPNAPGTPTVTAGTVTDTSVGLSWTAPVNGGVRTYTVERSTTSDFAIVTKTQNITGTTAIINGLSGNTTYYFRVVAVTTGGTATSAGYVSQLTLPTVPNITGVSNGSTGDAIISAAATWGGTGASSYNLMWSTTSTFIGGQSGTLSNVTSRTQNVIPVNTGTTVYFKVQAVYGTAPNTVTSAWSAVSNAVTAR